jgi:endonuclease/exonuclease/phosphatase family metal-dependent hydrolase
MPCSPRRLIVGCLFALLAVGPLAVTSVSTASTAPLPQTSIPSKKAAYQGYLATGGWLGMRLAMMPDGRIKVTWKGPKSNKGIKKWEILTSTTRKMDQHVKRYRFKPKARRGIVKPADLITPASGGYTFVQIRHYWGKPNPHVGRGRTLWIKAPTPTPPAVSDAVTVGTFNVRAWNLDKPSSPRSWDKRSGRVYSTIIGSGAGVVAIQEASGSVDVGYGAQRQWLALVNELNASEGGARWALSDDQPFETGGPAQGKGRQGTRMIYDTTQFELLAHGVGYTEGPSPTEGCWFPWARLRQKSTGKQLVFVATHLENGTDSAKGPYKLWSLRQKQAQAIISKVAELSAAYPGEQVIVAGDMNSTIYSPPDNVVHRLFIKAGFFDAFAAPEVVNGDYPTTNDFRFPLKPSPHRRDYIFTRGGPAGSYWYHNLSYRTEADVASDHFMQVASVPIG